MNRELCLPQVWSADRERRREAGVPEDVCFQTMGQLAQRMLERVADEDVSAGQDDGNTARYEAVRPCRGLVGASGLGCRRNRRKRPGNDAFAPGCGPRFPAGVPHAADRLGRGG